MSPTGPWRPAAVARLPRTLGARNPHCGSAASSGIHWPPAARHSYISPTACSGWQGSCFSWPSSGNRLARLRLRPWVAAQCKSHAVSPLFRLRAAPPVFLWRPRRPAISGLICIKGAWLFFKPSALRSFVRRWKRSGDLLTSVCSSFKSHFKLRKEVHMKAKIAKAVSAVLLAAASGKVLAAGACCVAGAACCIGLQCCM